MKKIAVYLIISVAAAALGACSSADNAVWDELPLKITTFLNCYFPEQAVDRYVEEHGDYYVNIKNGASIIFDAGYNWISVNGNGGTLPALFLFDEMPPALYAYLQENEAVNSVYKATRDATTYELALEDETISYNINTGIVTSPYGL